MFMNKVRLFISLFLIISLRLSVVGQISPGELSDLHSNLEGMSNCTKCHELGEKVSEEKCLACHVELKSRIDQKKGFHASPKAYKKSCFICHGEHHGRKYDIVHLKKDNFDHQATGFILEGKHLEKKCEDCHKAEHIADPAIKKKKLTYLGLNSACLSCHDDYHQKTLSADCAACHTFAAFKPAAKFDHSKAQFSLKGKHNAVDCSRCHPINMLNNKRFQVFKGLQFASCVNCHKDVHDNKFGQKCAECHSEESFKVVKSIGTFDHSKTNFKLEGKHSNVSCKSCHKVSLTAKLKYTRCSDCHIDFHKGQFTVKGVSSDCADCHILSGFQGSTYTLSKHNSSGFKLEGAHAATPCISCHKKGNEWQFRELNKGCASCHNNIHKGFIDEKYMPDGRCDKCHITTSWKSVTFDHKITTFALQGKHAEKSCRDCHFKKTTENQFTQQFSNLTGHCQECHVDIHQKQFDLNEKTECTTCHGGFENWKADRFNHDSTKFKLDGGHKGVSCIKCHTENKNGDIPFIRYKNTATKCIDCHI